VGEGEGEGLKDLGVRSSTQEDRVSVGIEATPRPRKARITRRKAHWTGPGPGFFVFDGEGMGR
jgi:hypothetical protein